MNEVGAASHREPGRGRAHRSRPSDGLILSELFLVIVLSSVAFERFFSETNLTNSAQRSRMLTGVLNDLMMIKLIVPTVKQGL